MFSQGEGFTEFSALWPALAFHAVVTGLGTGLLGRAVASPSPVEDRPAES